MDARTPREGAPDLASSNGLLNGNILLSTSSLSESPAQTASVPAQNMGAGAQQLDQLESQIKVLHQQALGTQSTLQQLKGRDAHSVPFDLLPDGPWVLGAEGLVLGLGALVLGGILGWYAWRRPVAKPIRVEVDFADSRQYLKEETSQPQPSVFKAPEVRAAASPPEQVFKRNFPEEVDFALSAPMADSESVLNLFWDDDKPPLQEPDQDLLESVPGADSSPFAPPSPSLEFDPEVAASEVERVRKSLADKRDARARQRVYDDWQYDSMDPAPVSADLAEQDEEPAEAEMHLDGLDLDLGADSQCESEAQAAPEPEPDLMVQAMKDLGQHSPEPSVDLLPHSDVPEPELVLDSAADVQEDRHEAGLEDGPAQVMAVAEAAAEDPPMVEFEFSPLAEMQDTPDTVPNVALLEPVQTLDADAPVGPNPAVQLELAQEFQALGLLQGARELALEVLENGDAKLQSQAQAFIDQLDTLETAQRVGALIDTPAVL